MLTFLFIIYLKEENCLLNSFTLICFEPKTINFDCEEKIGLDLLFYNNPPNY